MIKKILAPVQAWILLQGKCVGCGRSLSLGKKIEKLGNLRQVICLCGRIFMFDKRTGKYRRAQTAEVRSV